MLTERRLKMEKAKTKKMKLEQWLIINQMSCAVMNLNSVFCENPYGEEQGEYSAEDIAMIEDGIAEKTGQLALEDAIEVLTKALEKRIKLNESNMPR